ncbi:uncharacterized protein [Halyomorpha halys]|uniref:uncharacterized protein n=1 Tax=Halyomorpha halys TaxID=286706 RepID=UPI0006D4DE07|nr:uncharacterized protein LOC106684611 [Halyomorpha halys]
MNLRFLVPIILSILLPVLADEARGYPYHEHHHEIVELTEPSAEGYYTAKWRPQKSSPDLTSIGIIILLAKLLFLKAKGLGIGLVLLLKLPFVLIAFLSKLLVAIKAFKLAKFLTFALLIPFLIPLLLAPLLLLPLLLPLLLLLPIPVLTPTAAAAAAGRRKREIPRSLHTLRAVIESESCLEKIACQMAAPRQPSFYANFIAWSLNMMKIFFTNPRFESYADAYNKAKNSGRLEKCSELYTCSNPNLSMF